MGATYLLDAPLEPSFTLGFAYGSGRDADMILKDRYANVWAYDDKLQLMWHAQCNTGHYPFAEDVDGDGNIANNTFQTTGTVPTWLSLSYTADTNTFVAGTALGVGAATAVSVKKTMPPAYSGPPGEMSRVKPGPRDE